MPLGSELKMKIADVVNFEVSNFDEITGGDRNIRLFLQELGHTKSISIIDYLDAARTIHNAMILAPSIDNFIDSHRTNQRIAEVGKLAIAACILSAEKESKLFLDRSNANNNLNFSNLEETWFVNLFKILTQQCSWEDIDDRLSRLAIISFNYDRCAKHFLREALMTYYQVKLEEAERVISKLAIYYPYGSVGPMRFENGRHFFDFGEQPMSGHLIDYAKQLKTFTEGFDDSDSEIKSIRAVIQSSKVLVFLGFAFHPLNLKLLYGDKPPISGHAGDVFATAKGISECDVGVISSELRLLGGYSENNIRLRRDITASELINEFSRHLTQAVQSTA
ncbi:hypothetical protein AGMMS50256_05860 [Betaproteobacteria bacterium]|nr:hypothetical protein AGMMS50256_05860 [Betaproteobacteria bacterium]